MSVVTRVLFGAVLISLAGTACDDDSPAPESKITSVDALLARTCELAADCVDATREQIDACPADMRGKLNASQIAALEAIVALDKAEQDAILKCFDGEICGRFGVALTSMSDADLMEPLADCQ